MRTIKLTHEEIELIKNALQYVYDSKLDNLKQCAKIISKEESEKIIEVANGYYDLFEAINYGQKDV